MHPISRNDYRTFRCTDTLGSRHTRPAPDSRQETGMAILGIESAIFGVEDLSIFWVNAQSPVVPGNKPG